MHTCAEEVQEEAVAVMECQDIVRFEEPRYYDQDIGGLKVWLVLGHLKDSQIREWGEGGTASSACGDTVLLMSLLSVASER